MGAYSNSLNKGVVGFSSCIIQMFQLTCKLNKQECMAKRDMLHQLQWALKTYFGRLETKKSVSFCTKILDFFSAFQLHLKYLELGLVEKMSIALPICRECGAAV